MRRMSFGTSVSRDWDVRALARAIRAPDVDTRCWISLGIVATVRDDGAGGHVDPHDLIDDENPNAVFVSPEGVMADVVLTPWMDRVTCRVPSGGRRSTDDAPLAPGDEVLVAVPSGTGVAGAVVLKVLNSAADRLPVGPDGKPLFQNDRRLIWADGVPIDLRTGAIRVLLDPQNEILLLEGPFRYPCGADAVGQLILGTSYRAAENAMFRKISAALNALQAVCVGPLSPLKPGVIAAKLAVDAFLEEASTAGDWLSTVS